MYTTKYKKRRKANHYPKKDCYFVIKGIEYVDYKNIRLLKRFISNKCKILPRKITGTSAKYQRQLNSAIKKARILGMLPFVRR